MTIVVVMAAVMWAFHAPTAPRQQTVMDVSAQQHSSRHASTREVTRRLAEQVIARR
jgi:hypothetical protein